MDVATGSNYAPGAAHGTGTSKERGKANLIHGKRHYPPVTMSLSVHC